VRVVGDAAGAQLADRPAVAAPAGALEQRGRPRVGFDWVVRSPVRMLVVIALIVGVPVNVFGQYLADNARDDFREVALAKVDGGSYAGANLVGERMSAVRYRTEAVAGRARVRSLMAARDFEALEQLLGEELLLYSNDVASTGREGLRLAKELRPTVVFSDVSMPDMDGFQLAGALRADPELAKIPIVFITASVQRADIEEAMRYGAARVIGKPFSVTDLRALVAEFA
jgi:CheY-like chemotaxis protein